MPRHLAAAIVCVTCGGLLAPAGEARAQCDYSLTIHPPSDIDGGAYLHALTVFDDGSGPAVVAAGSEILERPGSSSEYYNIAKWRPSTGWEPLGEPDDMYNVHDLDVFRGQLYATDQWGPHRWTGSEWQALGTGLVGWARELHDDGSGARLIANGGGSQFPSAVQWNGESWSAIGNLQSIGFGSSIRAIATFDDGGGPALIVSNFTRMARWNGTFWGYLPNFGADALLADGDTMYMGNPFSIWAAGGDPLAIESVIGGGTFDLGVSPTLHANVVHGGAVNYQWRLNGMPLHGDVGSYSGVRASTLRIWNIEGSHEGVYDVVVNNDCTTVISDPIPVDVIGTCMGDITVDGAVDINDLLALVTVWGVCQQFQPCLADLTHDGAVNIDDFLTVIARWGECP